MRVRVELTRERKLLRDIPNGTFFTGSIDGFVSAGPFLKVGSVTEKTWVVVKLESMEGGVWVSGRNSDSYVSDFQALDIRRIALSDSIGPQQMNSTEGK